MSRHQSRRAKISAVLLIFVSTALAGCSTPMLAGLTLGEFSLFGSVFSTAATGKGLGEHAMDAATGRDCRILEGLTREDRNVCERRNSPALENDWQGLASLADEGDEPAQAGRREMPPRHAWDG